MSGDVARVVVDLSLDRVFDYRIPESLRGRVVVGSAVRVPFGRRMARGFVVDVGDRSEHPQLKDVAADVGEGPLLAPTVLKIARWMAEYYLAPVENAVRTVLPGAVRHEKARFVERLRVELSGRDPTPEERAALHRRAPKQSAVLDFLKANGGHAWLSKLVAACHATETAVKALEGKGWVRIESSRQARRPDRDAVLLPTAPPDLMPQQVEALDVIRGSIDRLDPRVVLLHGVTGSGKTEVYLGSIRHALDRGRGAIVLVPEISLTPQTVERFRGRFGDRVAVLHSHLSSGERHDEWHRVRDGQADIVVGARSALFAPVPRLGLIVVDEEHEPSYKQEEAPRYNARDMAVLRGSFEPCAVVLGSATPSLESFRNAQAGRYRLVRMPHRVDHRSMPEFKVVDMRREAEREGRMNILSRDLKEAISDRLYRAEQVILFLNRRGFSTSLVCQKCGHVEKCTECSVPRVFHKQRNEMVCHLCGGVSPVPARCPNPECGDPGFRYSGYGTERVAEVLEKVFPKARIARMDADTMTRKESYRKVLGEFRTGKLDILLGTQMIAKGLDFPNVTLVGVLNADVALHLPDFRAGERTFQLLTQVAGRAGRGDVEGEVIVQTFTPHHPAIQAARRLDYDGFADQELAFRQELQYPPYAHLVCLLVRGKKEQETSAAAGDFHSELKRLLPSDVILSEPAPAPIARIQGDFRFQILLRTEKWSTARRTLRDLIQRFRWPAGVTGQADVDALSLL